MCKAKADNGGRRCLPHLQQALAAKESALQALEGRWTGTQVRKAKQDIHELKHTIKFRQEEKAERQRKGLALKEKKRAAKLQRLQTITPSQVSTASYSLTAFEHEKLAREAVEARMTKAEYIRWRLTQPPTMVNASAAELKHQRNTEHDYVGRKPTVSSTKRTATKVRLSPDTKQHIEEQAGKFMLTVSDYTRSVLTGQDPRLGFGHMSKDTQEGRVARFSEIEREHGYKHGADASEFYFTVEAPPVQEEAEATQAA